MVTFIYFLAIFFFMLVCAVLCFVILIQESKSAGLGASFGGDSSDSLFGTSTADVLNKVTGWLAVAFLTACIILSFWTSSMGHTRPASAADLPEMEQIEE